MYRSGQLVFSLIAFAMLSFFTATSAYADAVQLISPSQLSPSGITASYTGQNGTTLPSPYSFSAGGNTLTLSLEFGGSFFRFNSDGITTDFSTGTALIDTNGSSGSTDISFQAGVMELGLYVQSAGQDFATFDFTAFNGANPILSFSVGPIDNTSTRGMAIFLGAHALNGDVITHVTISSRSSDPNFSNYFILGPITFTPTTTPEPTTILLLGTGLIGAIGIARRRLKAERHRGD